MENKKSELNRESIQRLPPQAALVMRTVANSAISGGVGVEASDYNDPSYFFLNWPALA